MRKLLLFSSLLCGAGLTGCAAAQVPIGPARITVLEEGRNYEAASPSKYLLEYQRLKCQQRLALPVPAPPKLSYDKRTWVNR